MSRSQAIRAAGAVAPWLCAGAAVAALAAAHVSPHSLRPFATLAALLAVVAGAVLAAGWAPALAGHIAAGPARLAWPLAIALAAGSGGVGSPAVALCALCALAALWGRSAWRVAVGAGVTVAALAASNLVLQRALPVEDLAHATLLVGALTLVPAWQAARSRRLETGAALPELESLLAEAALGDRDRPVTLGRRADSSRRRDAQRRTHLEPLAGYLAQVRDHVGADEVIFWRFGASGAALTPEAWSTAAGGEPTHFDADQWTPLVAWSAQQRIVHCAAEGATPVVAAAPAVDDGQCVGAVSVSAAAGLGEPRDALKQWLPRYAAHAAVLARLVRQRQDAALHSRHTSALLQAAQEFQANRSATALGQSICETALRVTPAVRAALIRWHSGLARGEVHSVTRGHMVGEGLPVDEASHVGAACRSGLPQLWENARSFDQSTPVYGAQDPSRPLGALGVVPLKHGGDVIGAIVLEGDTPGDVLIHDARHVRLLGALAAASLAAVWEMEEVAERARTDQLTGLANRRYFDEHLARMLNEADRFGGSVSLVLVDIDFFKRVNDSHGHDAGDAVLRAVAATIRERARSVDVCARYGGEELALLLPQTPMTGAFEVAERLRRAVAARPVLVRGTQIPITASFGVATYPESAHSRDALFPAADRALYRAKSDGRNCVKCAPVIRQSRTT